MFQDDDDVTITNYPDDDEDVSPRSNYIDSQFSQLFSTIGSSGWVILGSLILVIYIWSYHLQHHFYQWLRKRENRQYEATHHKDPDVLRKEKEKMEQARLRLQEKYEKEAQIFKEKMEEKEALKREQRAAALNIDGVRLKDSVEDDSDKKNHKPAYNPLMGSSSLPSYRPPRRTACSRGNCG
ncbi:selenoprotein S B-like [Planococcus citri]|uniref:selenoprotein S B-like n=1 Tax=Planococcus citri TaxID=170843 RepID=UPI0031FA0407